MYQILSKLCMDGMIKLLDRRGTPSFEDAEGYQKKIKRDARSSRGVESLIAKIKDEYNFSDGKSRSYQDFYISRLNQLILISTITHITLTLL